MLGRDKQDTQDIQCELSVRVQDRRVKVLRIRRSEMAVVGRGLPTEDCTGEDVDHATYQVVVVAAQHRINQAMKVSLAGATSLKEGWM